ncbi:MAG: hypothetical protein BM556_09000 [Bacteriovorax sp. MedPE-SWde]|nr:MAG: hypothetical protein BM556_09000 [Bacteriovorax sp. MedPE-SWde]
MKDLASLKNKKIFISTILPEKGGVPQLLRNALALIKPYTSEITVGYYQPRSISPDLSVSTWELFRKTIGHIESEKDGVKYVGIGSYLPELENFNYYPSKTWKEYINQADICICISGSILQALPFHLLKKKCVTWCATPYKEDRIDRVSLSYGKLRRIFDAIFVMPFGLFLEKILLRSKYIKVLPLSEYTKKELSKVREIKSPTLGSPINMKEFTQVPKFKGKEIRIGFVGRLADPRKNITILLKAIEKVREIVPNIKLVFCGEQLSDEDRKYVEEKGINQILEHHSFVTREELITIYESIDLFVIPSLQEGLAIVGLEAMATGSPIITTKCGGPEEYVINGKNGYIVDFDHEELKDRIIDIINFKNKDELSNNSRKIVEDNYSIESFSNKLSNALKFVLN